MVFFAMDHLAGLSFKTLWNLPSSSKKHIFYIVLHSHVKSYIYIYIYIHIYIYIVFSDSIKLQKYIYFYTYMECKSWTIYMHNTG